MSKANFFTGKYTIQLSKSDLCNGLFVRPGYADNRADLRPMKASLLRRYNRRNDGIQTKVGEVIFGPVKKRQIVVDRYIGRV